MRSLTFRNYRLAAWPRHFSELGISSRHLLTPAPYTKAPATENKELQVSGIKKIVYDFIKYFSDVRDHAIGTHEISSREDAVRGRELAYQQAREMLRVARDKQESFIKYQKHIASLHSKLITSDETFKEHLYDRIRRAESERPFPASYDPLSTDATTKDSVYFCERTLDTAASALFEARELLYQKKLESTQKREDVNKIIAIISVLLSLAVVEPIRRYFLIRYNSAAKIKYQHDMSMQTEEPIIIKESRPILSETEKIEEEPPLLARDFQFQEQHDVWLPFLRGLSLGLGAGLGFGTCLALANSMKR